jgi:hypothetical protein
VALQYKHSGQQLSLLLLLDGLYFRLNLGHKLSAMGACIGTVVD